MKNTMDHLPEKVKRRLDLFKMFYPLERRYERRWAKVFKSDFDVVSAEFKKISAEQHYDQEEVNNQFILWREPEESSVECMFYFVKDAANLGSVIDCFKTIQQKKVFLTYAIVHQKKDGENVFDIFRFSRFSYLEHCNRIKYP